MKKTILLIIKKLLNKKHGKAPQVLDINLKKGLLFQLRRIDCDSAFSRLSDLNLDEKHTASFFNYETNNNDVVNSVMITMQKGRNEFNGSARSKPCLTGYVKLKTILRYKDLYCEELATWLSKIDTSRIPIELLLVMVSAHKKANIIRRFLCMPYVKDVIEYIRFRLGLPVWRAQLTKRNKMKIIKTINLSGLYRFSVGALSHL